MAKMETVCIVCGEKSRDETMPVSCPICNASLETQKETVLKQAECRVTLTGDMAAGEKGKLILTSQRIFWIGDPSVQVVNVNRASLSLMKSLTKKLIPNPKEMRFSLGLDEITNIEILKKGPFRVLTITAFNGEKIVPDIKSKDRQGWIDAVNDAKKRLVLSGG